MPLTVPPPTVEPTHPAPRDILDDLERLGQLKAAGVLDDAELARLKAHLLDAALRA